MNFKKLFVLVMFFSLYPNYFVAAWSPELIDKTSDANVLNYEGVEIPWGISPKKLVEVVNKPAAWWNPERRKPGKCNYINIFNTSDNVISDVRYNKIADPYDKLYVTNYLTTKYPFFNTPGLTVYSSPTHGHNWIFWDNQLFALLDAKQGVLFGSNSLFGQIKTKYALHVSKASGDNFTNVFNREELGDDLLNAGIYYSTYKNINELDLVEKPNEYPFTQDILELAYSGMDINNLNIIKQWWNFLVSAEASHGQIGSIYFKMKVLGISYVEAVNYSKTNFCSHFEDGECTSRVSMWIKLKANGISASEAMEWSNLGYVDVRQICEIDMGYSFTDNLNEAKEWLSLMTFDSAITWHKEFTVDEVKKYKEARISLVKARTLKKDGLPLVVLNEWFDVGISDPKLIKKYRQLKFSPFNAKEWEKSGIPPNYWKDYKKAKISPEEASQWVKFGFNSTDARWIAKTITISDAKKLLKANVPKREWKKWKRYVERNKIELE